MPEFDNTQAASEGWCLSDCEGSLNGPWQIQKLDEADTFSKDEQAWRFVVLKAASGSLYHLEAIAFIREHNPQEWDCITSNINPAN